MGMTDEYRDTMFRASLKMRLATPRVITRTVFDPVSLEEFKRIMLDKSPVHLWCDKYSANHPCYIITKRIVPSDGGIWMYAHSWADKTPKLVPWDKAYRMLNVSPGLHELKF